MTLLSKSNLVVSEVASGDPFDKGINGVRVEPDGSTVACNGKVLLAVSPVDESKIHYPDVGEVVTPGDNGIVLALDHVKEAFKNIPKSKKLSLNHCQMTKSHIASDVELTSAMESGMERRVALAPKRDGYPDWKGIVRKAVGVAGVTAKACVNRKDLIALLQAMEKACPDRGGDSPVYIEFGKGLVLRSVHRDSGQRAVGVVNPYNTGDHWLERSYWEKRIFEVVKKVAKVKKKLLRRKMK